MAAPFEVWGVPRTSMEISSLVVRMAEENRGWGYRRLQGALANLGYSVARTTIANILKRHGIEPAPERNRKTSWKEFLRRHWDQIIAADFFTVEVWDLYRFDALHGAVLYRSLDTTRRNRWHCQFSEWGLWMAQIARNLNDIVDGFFTGKRYLIHDRDPLYTKEFLGIIDGSGIKAIKPPPRSPN